jgi:hypothetical protein
MRVTITYELPDEQHDCKCALHGVDLLRIIEEVDDDLRKILKYNSKKFKSPAEALEYVRDLIRQEFNDRGMNQDYFAG